LFGCRFLCWEILVFELEVAQKAGDGGKLLVFYCVFFVEDEVMKGDN